MGNALNNLWQARDRQHRNPRVEYVDLLRRSLGNQSQPGDADRIVELAQELNVKPEQDAEVLRKKEEQERAIENLKRDLGQSESVEDIRKRIADIDRQIIEQVEPLLERKREAMRQIEDRRNWEEVLRREDRERQGLERKAPHLFIF